MSSQYKRRIWVTAIGVWVRYETAAKKAAPKTTRNPNVHRTSTVHSECGWETGGLSCGLIQFGAQGRKQKPF